jgi:single-strand DNA-binding protein
MLFIEGRIKTRQYQDSQGVTKYITEIIAERMNLLTKSSPGGEQKQEYPHAHEAKPLSDDSGFTAPAAPEDDLPF